MGCLDLIKGSTRIDGTNMLLVVLVQVRRLEFVTVAILYHRTKQQLPGGIRGARAFISARSVPKAPWTVPCFRWWESLVAVGQC